MPADLGFVYEPDRARVRVAEGRAIDGLSALVVEFRSAFDPRRWIELRGRLLRGLMRRSARLSCLAVDVTVRVEDQRAREHALGIAARAHFDVLRCAEAAPHHAWTARADGARDTVGARALAYFGVTVGGLLGHRWLELLHPDDVERCAAAWSAAVASGAPYEVEHRLLGASGRHRWFSSRAAPLRDENGRIARWVGTDTDIDELKQASIELEERATYEKHLIGIVSHDLRAPLQAIGLAADHLAATASLSESAMRAVRTICRASGRASRLVRDLLDVAKARSGAHIPIDRRPLHLAAILEPAIREASAVFPRRRVVLDVRGDVCGMWDGDRLSQVVENALANALRYSPPDTPVRIRATGRDEVVELEVTNDGVPIDSSKLRELFQPMTRGDNDASDRDGVGLGLFIVKEIVTAHGGTVDLASDASLKTRLRVVLPRA